ncbi:MAG: COG1361 S-layer family protein [Nanoarchaeota archaeon]
MKKIVLFVVICICLVTVIVHAQTYMNAGVANTYIDVTLVNQIPDPVEPGQYIELRFKFENWGSDVAQDISVELLPKYPFSLEPGESAIKNIGSLQGRQVDNTGIIVKYRLKVDENAVEGENEIELRFKINNKGYTSSWEKHDPFTINIQTHDAIISVESVESEPKEFAPGGEGVVSIKIKNMADSVLKEIRAKLEVSLTKTTTTSIITTEYPFSPIGSTNEKTITILDPGKETDFKFNLIADPNAEANVYKVPLSLIYSDELGKNYSKQLIISLVIGEEPDLAVNFEESTITAPKTKGTVSIKFINKGTNNIKFCYVTLLEDNGYSILSTENVYIGNIDSDDYETVDFDLYINSEEDIFLPLTVEYKDANNKDYKKNIKIPLKIYSSEDAKKYGIVQSNSKVGIMIVILIVITGLFFYWRIRKKKKVKK